MLIQPSNTTPFLRRCVQFDLPEPDEQKLSEIVGAHFNSKISKEAKALIGKYLEKRGTNALATDQLLNAVHMLHDSGQTFSPDAGDSTRGERSSRLPVAPARRSYRPRPRARSHR